MALSTLHEDMIRDVPAWQEKLGILIGFAQNLTELSEFNPLLYKSIDLLEANKKGRFVWESGNLTSQLTSDPLKGIYVPYIDDPTGLTGAWVRQYDGAALVTWWGAHPTNTDNTTIYNSVINSLSEGKTIIWPKITGTWAGSFVSQKSFKLKLNHNLFSEAPFSSGYGLPVFQFSGNKTLLTTLTQNVQYGDETLTMVSTAGLSAGSIIILEDQRVRPSDSTKVNQELIRVREVVNGTQVKVFDKCRSFQSSGTRNVYLVTPIIGARIADGICRINNPWDASAPSGHANDIFSIYQGDNCEIVNCEVYNHYGNPIILRDCINSRILNPNVHDGFWPAVGSYGPSCYVGRDILIEGAVVRNCRNTVDFAQVYCGTMRHIRGYDSNGCALAHNLYGGNITAEDVELTIHGPNYGLNWSAQNIAEAATAMIIRDVTIKNLKVLTDQSVGGTGGQFYAIYLQAPFANLMINGVRYGTTAASTSTGFASNAAIRLQGYPAGPVQIRNVQQISTSDQAVGAQTQGIDCLILIDAPVGVSTRVQYPISISDCAAMKCHKVVWGRGVKHLVTMNLTTVILDGTNVKVVETLNDIVNVTNQSLGIHAALS